MAWLAAPKLAKRGKAGGARRDRTADLVIANDALSQLSYGPSAAAPDTSQGQPAVGAIYNPCQGQVKNAEIVVFRRFGPDFPCLGGGEPLFGGKPILAPKPRINPRLA